MPYRLGIEGLPCHSLGLGTIVARTPNLSSWSRCLDKTGLLSVIDESGPWTVLAPTDRLLESSGRHFTDLLLPENADALCDFVESLIIRRSVLALQIDVHMKGEVIVLPVSNLLDQSVVAELGTKSVFWSGAASVGQILCGNGELHLLDSFPRGTGFASE